MTEPITAENLAEVCANLEAYIDRSAAALAAPAIKAAEEAEQVCERRLPDLQQEFARQWRHSERQQERLTRERDDARTAADRLRTELTAAQERISDLERDRARRPQLAAVLDLVRQIRDDQPKDADVAEMVLKLWGEAS